MTSTSYNVAMTALKVSSRVLYEKLARPMAREAGDVPRSPDAITPEWLTAVLCSRHARCSRHGRQGRAGERRHARAPPFARELQRDGPKRQDCRRRSSPNRCRASSRG